MEEGKLCDEEEVVNVGNFFNKFSCEKEKIMERVWEIILVF